MGGTGEGKAGGEKQKVRGEEERKWHKVEPEGGEAKSERNRREMVRRLWVLFPRQKGLRGRYVSSRNAARFRGLCTTQVHLLLWRIAAWNADVGGLVCCRAISVQRALRRIM